MIGREGIDFINVPLDQSQINKLNATHVSSVIASLTLSCNSRDQIRESIMILLTMGLNSDHFPDQPFKTQSEFQNDQISLSNS